MIAVIEWRASCYHWPQTITHFHGLEPVEGTLYKPHHPRKELSLAFLIFRPECTVPLIAGCAFRLLLSTVCHMFLVTEGFSRIAAIIWTISEYGATRWCLRADDASIPPDCCPHPATQSAGIVDDRGKLVDPTNFSHGDLVPGKIRESDSLSQYSRSCDTSRHAAIYRSFAPRNI